MALKPVAVTSDVAATAGTGLYTGAAKGTWMPGPVTVSTYAKLTIGGAAAAWQAKSTFAFAGFGPTPAETPISGTSTVTLSASTKKLQGRASHVLVNGDEKSDSYGNKVKVSASGKLRSA